jgi:hypothetical protein
MPNSSRTSAPKGIGTTLMVRRLAVFLMVPKGFTGVSPEGA